MLVGGVVHWVSGKLYFIAGLVSEGDWAPNAQIGRLEGVVHWVSEKLYFIAGLVSEGDWAPNAQIGRLEG